MKKVLVVLSMLALSACGKDGTNGQDGSQGNQGIPGNSGITQVVQFCPNVTPSYPSTFPEVGFVINGQVYAVYSQNGGFMTLLTPGVYNSPGINAVCNFTVNADGSVSQ